MQHLDQQDTAALTLLGGLFGGQFPTAPRWVAAAALAQHEVPLRWADSREWITRRQHAPSGQWRLCLTRLGVRELAVFLRQVRG